MADDAATGEARAVRDPAGYDHLQAAEDAHIDPGIYRVVGVHEDRVVLLHVGDTDGRRVNTGRVTAVDRPLDAFAPADNPDGNRSAGATVRGALDGLAWQLRTFFANLAVRPLATLAALALVIAGHQGDRFLSGPDAAFTVVYFFGVLALVYVGARGG
jgi:hypothetical protein